MESVQKTTPRQPICTLSGPRMLADAACGLSVTTPVVVSGGGGGAPGGIGGGGGVGIRGGEGGGCCSEQAWQQPV